MEHYIDENMVMQFYLECLANDDIRFLQGKTELKSDIIQLIEKLSVESKINNKIQIAAVLWKKLFEAAMSFISSNKKGYDKIFDYFDSYVEFEELIFASDSFYRDHTLHCLWVYFLGEYLYKNAEFSVLCKMEREKSKSYKMLAKLPDSLKLVKGGNAKALTNVLKILEDSECLKDSVRCISALSHDLGYPLKKFEKINKSMNKVLPYFAIHNFDNFSFEYENIQQEFVNSFIDFIARQSIVELCINDNISLEAMVILDKTIGIPYHNEGDVSDFVTKIELLTGHEKKLLTDSFKVNTLFHAPFSQKAAYYNDFETYQHGIMSAFLLMKNIRVFQDIDYCRPDWCVPIPDANVLALHDILSSISNHTSDSYQIQKIDDTSFLTFVDELEEFSRISRANQNREYVDEFCDTAIFMEGDWLNVVFEFNNTNLDNLNPEISFKGKCKRFLSLFDIPNMDKYLKIRVTVVGKLPTDQNEYILEIAKNHADIRINGDSKDIPKYLESTQFFTKEEYAHM